MDDLTIAGLAVIGIGVLTGALMIILRETRSSTAELSSPELGTVSINTASIPIRGGIGAAILIVILLTGVLIALPELRLVALLGMLAGAIIGAVLTWWHRHHVNPDAPIALGLH